MFDSTTATQADVTVYKAFQRNSTFTRWFNHIASFTEEFEDLPAGKAPAASGSAAAAAEEDDEDVDLFGSDDEVDEEAEKLKQQRLAEYAAKKAAKGPNQLPNLLSPWMSNHGTMKLIWMNY